MADSFTARILDDMQQVGSVDRGAADQAQIQIQIQIRCPIENSQ